MHDDRVYVNSMIFRKAERQALFPNDIVSIEGVQVPIVLLGGSSIPPDGMADETFLRTMGDSRIAKPGLITV